MKALRCSLGPITFLISVLRRTWDVRPSLHDFLGTSLGCFCVIWENIFIRVGYWYRTKVIVFFLLMLLRDKETVPVKITFPDEFSNDMPCLRCTWGVTPTPSRHPTDVLQTSLCHPSLHVLVRAILIDVEEQYKTTLWCPSYFIEHPYWFPSLYSF